jgi:hypothetical protein
MIHSRSALLAALTALAASLFAAPSPAPDSQQPTESVDMAEMMKRAERFTSPGVEHRWLERFLGEWESELRIVMPGMESAAPERGSARGRWLIDGRWLALEGEGTMMGMPVRSFHLIGYDRFKMSYVTASVSSLDTALAISEGDVDPRSGALLAYGTIDEYLTGEHDKMVKYVWRFPDANTMTLEVHDLPIGETGTKVIEMTWRRRKGA